MTDEKKKILDERSYVFAGEATNLISAAFLYLPKDKNLMVGHYNWVTKEGYRNQGAASRLVRALVKKSFDLGYKKAGVNCFENSLLLAKKIGFQDTSTKIAI